MYHIDHIYIHHHYQKIEEFKVYQEPIITNIISEMTELSKLHDPNFKIPDTIKCRLDRNLHLLKNHPIEIVKRMIYDYFKELDNYKFEYFDDLSPIVTIEDNFDKLLIPKDHPARSKSDTYYVNDKMVLRTHTSAHQNELLAKGVTSMLVVGDVYRKDEVDRKHYPVFHQIEGLSIVSDGVDPLVELKKILSGLVEHLFPGCNYRYNDDYFPFTDPSLEIEVEWEGEWLEILGCGVTQEKILTSNGINKKAWAFGMGLERLAMILFSIPDIRLFWEKSNKFLSQFDGSVKKFAPYSNIDPTYVDISFYLSENEIEINGDDFVWTKKNDFFELCREESGDVLEEVTLFDSYINKKKNKYSNSYRLKITPFAEIINNAELTTIANDTMERVRKSVAKMNIELR